MLIPIWLLAAATVYFGLDASLTAGIAGKAAALLIGSAP
jgi:multicomponent Na+:H+ antiporter subunit D